MKKIYSSPESVLVALQTAPLMDNSITAHDEVGDVDGPTSGWHSNRRDFEDEWDDEDY